MDDNGTGTGSPAPGPFDAASAFDSLLSADASDTQEEEATTVEAEAQADDQTNAETETDEESGNVEAQSDEHEEADEQPAAEQTFTVRVDGKDESVRLSELLSGYSRTADYTRKTQVIASERKQLEAEHAQARKERAEYATLLPKLRQAVEAGIGKEPNWEELRAADPVKASIEWQRWQERKARLAQVDAETARVRATQAEEEAAMRNAVLIEQRQKLLEKMPTWKDKKVAAAESGAVTDLLRSVGFADSELAIYDHRAMLIAVKAAKYDALMSEKSKLKGKIDKAPVVKPGGGTPKVTTHAGSARDRFMRSGTVQDAAGLFKHLV
jgi:hypothetical protein